MLNPQIAWVPPDGVQRVSGTFYGAGSFAMTICPLFAELHGLIERTVIAPGS